MIGFNINSNLNKMEKTDIRSLFFMATGIVIDVDASNFIKIKTTKGGEVVDTEQCEYDIKNRDR